MKLTRFALNRPVTVLMAFATVVLIGLISWNRLPVELLPSLNYPQITIMTAYENVAPPEIESLISKPLEEAVGTVQGVTRVASVSKEGISLVTLNFDWGVDMNTAALDVREKIDGVRDALPRDMETPVIIKFDPTSLPIMTLGISGQVGMAKLTQIASEEIKQKLERIPGVALARISGAVEREILVSVDQGRLLAYGIPISRVVERLKEANFNFPGGRIEQGKQEIRIRTMGEFESLNDLRNVVIATTTTNIPVFLRDVATVHDTFKDRTSFFAVNGAQSVGISIFKQADSNTVRVAQDVRRVLNRLREKLEPRVHLALVYDQATFIEEAVSDLARAGIIGGFIAFVVLLLFLRSFSSALIITTAIPISVLGAFALMYLTGISLNIMSLGGLALGVGLLVDNGIVILENINRHAKGGKTNVQAVIAGAEEMYTPVVASTFAHIVVFVPILFVQGISGRFFAQLALTISFSLVISIFVALALNPMLEARSLWAGANRSGEGKLRNPSRGMSLLWGRLFVSSTKVSGFFLEPVWRVADRMLRSTAGMYRKALVFSVANKKKVILGSIAVLVMSTFLYPVIGQEFLPQVDQGSFLLQVTTPAGTTLESTGKTALQIEEILSAEPEVKDVFVNIGYDKKEKTESVLGETKQNVARETAVLREKRKRTTRQVVNAVRAKIAGIPGVEVDYIFNQDVTQFTRQKERIPELLEISGPDMATLRRLSDQVVERLKAVKGLRDVATSLGSEEPEVQVSVDREKAASYGLSVKQIGDTLKTAMDGEVATKYRDQAEDVDILVRLQKGDRQSIPALQKIFIQAPNGRAIPLSELAVLTGALRLHQIERRGLSRVSLVSANISGIKQSDAVRSIREAIKNIDVPPEYEITMSEQEKEMGRSFRGLSFALLLSIVLVYMLLASLFESFLYPFIIMLSVPLAAVGVFLALFVTGKSVSLGVYIGGIMLGGIVVNNSIILVDYINTLRKKGLGREEAIVEGGMARLRPILMTAMTTIFGLVPLALAAGKGAEIRSPLAVTVIGGLTTSTVMTLVVVPVMYALIEDIKDAAARAPG
jgi:hydrophobic/amphiphilic exporter-1 (mainly G- bacteria), HAE1 family